MDNSSLNRLLTDFYTLFEMDISVLDADFHTLSLARCQASGFCSFINRLEGGANACKSSDIERLNYVKNTGKAIIYTCPYGLTEAIVPVIREDSIAAYIISTLGINIEEREDEDVLNGVMILSKKISSKKLESSISSLRHLSSDEINAYLTVLKLLAEHIANNESIAFSTESIGKLVKRYVKNNLNTKLTLSELARNLHCSTVTLTEHFKSEFGITIVEYITEKRMQLSEKLMITTELPLREISALSGYADVEYFSRTFKKFHGISPAAWRRKEKSEDG